LTANGNWHTSHLLLEVIHCKQSLSAQGTHENVAKFLYVPFGQLLIQFPLNRKLFVAQLVQELIEEVQVVQFCGHG
jgi:hypothetical protein